VAAATTAGAAAVAGVGVAVGVAIDGESAGSVDPPEPAIRSTTLASGLRVVTEADPNLRSVALGCWVTIGGRDEPEHASGASHFLEHLLFKGTEHRSARDIAESVDACGGEMNAFTAREHTAYYLRLPAGEVDFGLDLLGDVIASPAFRPTEVEAERQVILEELHAGEDDPEERAHSLCFEALFPGHPLGREVLGTAASITAMAPAEITGFHEAHYRPPNLLVVAAGNLDHDEVVAGVAARFPDQPADGVPRRAPPDVAPLPQAELRRRTEQVHLVAGWRAFALDDDDRYPLAVLDQILGGGLSSRLFQEVREARGLAYAVYSSSVLFSDAGALVVYAGTGPGRLGELRAVIDAVVARLVDDGVTAREVEVAKGSLTGSVQLGLEDSASRLGRLGASLAAHGEVIPIGTYLARMRAVTVDDVGRVAQRVLASSRTVAIVGPAGIV
jgi:predicted Zn-dependent peptidase